MLSYSRVTRVREHWYFIPFHTRTVHTGGKLLEYSQQSQA